MPDLAYPGTCPTPSGSSFELQTNDAAFESPLTGTVRTLERKGARWRVTLTFDDLDGAERAELQGFLAKVRGFANRVLLPIFAHTNRGAGGGTPVVSGGSQSGATLNSSGWPITTTVLRRGDFFSVNGELKIVTDDVVSDGAGLAAINFSPILRSPPPDATAIVLPPSTALRVMLADGSIGWNNAPAFGGGLRSSFAIDFIEAF